MRWTRHTTKVLVKLLVFSALCIALAVALVVRIGNIQLFTHDATYSAQLADASGLIPGDEVKISGVDVGRVQSVSVQRGHALVSFDVQPSVHLRSSTGAGLQWLDVIGQKVLYLYPGKSGGFLRPGATIPLANSVSDASVGALLNALGPFLQAIDPKEGNAFLTAVAGALNGNNAEVHSLISHAATVASGVGSVSGQLGSVIDNLDVVLSAIASHQGAVASLADNLSALSQSLAQHNSLLDDTVGNLGTVEHELANMLSTNRQNFDTIIASLKSVAANLDRHKRMLGIALHTLPAGLAPYQEISSYGQWFQIDTVFTCVANQESCSYQQPTHQPGSSSPAPASQGGGLQQLYQTLSGGAS
jgi:phospholipid/cholesterol/gamma-HCH transport system substrate-binding protein